MSDALVKAVVGPRSKLKTRMVPFLNSPLVNLQHKLCILQLAAGPRTLCGFLCRGQTKAQAQTAFEQADILFSDTYEQLLQQPAGTFHPGQPGRHKEQAELPRHHGGYNLPTLVNLHEPECRGSWG